VPKRNRVTNDSGHKQIQKRAIPLLLSCITTFPLFSVQSSANSGIDVYPPNWWVGMQNSNVELMLYGDDVADDTVSITKGDASVKHSQALDSENYLFVTLDTSNVSAQELVIRLTDSDGTTRDLTYTLEKRTQGSASREGFGPQDAIYLIAPDRYANRKMIMLRVMAIPQTVHSKVVATVVTFKVLLITSTTFRIWALLKYGQCPCSKMPWINTVIMAIPPRITTK